MAQYLKAKCLKNDTKREAMQYTATQKTVMHKCHVAPLQASTEYRSRKCNICAKYLEDSAFKSRTRPDTGNLTEGVIPFPQSL
jgi:hypothetical protein